MNREAAALGACIEALEQHVRTGTTVRQLTAAGSQRSALQVLLALHEKQAAPASVVVSELALRAGEIAALVAKINHSTLPLREVRQLGEHLARSPELRDLLPFYNSLLALANYRAADYQSAHASMQRAIAGYRIILRSGLTYFIHVLVEQELNTLNIHYQQEHHSRWLEHGSQLMSFCLNGPTVPLFTREEQLIYGTTDPLDQQASIALVSERLFRKVFWSIRNNKVREGTALRVLSGLGQSIDQEGPGGDLHRCHRNGLLALGSLREGRTAEFLAAVSRGIEQAADGSNYLLFFLTYQMMKWCLGERLPQARRMAELTEHFYLHNLRVRI